MPDAPVKERPFWRRQGMVVFLVVLVSSLHYLTPHGDHGAHAHHVMPSGSFDWNAAFHGIYRRLYYFPIILAAFRGGVRGGLGAALFVVCVYIPHAFARELGIDSVVIPDPGMLAEKILEIILYLAMGLLAGLLVERLNLTSRNLRQTLDEKTAMEEELVRTARMAAIGRLSAGLAHEIRNPLASIRGAAEVLNDDYPTENPKRRMLEILLKEAERLNTVLSRFLDFARSRPSRRDAFDVVEEARSVLELMGNQKDIPPLELMAPLPCRALGQAEEVRQILVNLLLNAAALSPPDQPLLLEVRPEGDHATIRVLDRGPGFSDEALANFGTPFFSTRSGGTGLGLATSLLAAENMGGNLRVDRTYQEGACVVLELPLATTRED